MKGGKRGERENLKRISWDGGAVRPELKTRVENMAGKLFIIIINPGHIIIIRGIARMEAVLKSHRRLFKYHNTLLDRARKSRRQRPIHNLPYVGSVLRSPRSGGAVGLNLSNADVRRRSRLKSCAGRWRPPARKSLLSIRAIYRFGDYRTRRMATDLLNHGRCVSRRHSAYADCRTASRRVRGKPLLRRMTVAPCRTRLRLTPAIRLCSARATGMRKPEWAADITGIPATRIRQLAREIASARACYIYPGRSWGRSVMPAKRTNVRACSDALPALTTATSGGPAPTMATGPRYAVWRAIVARR